MNDIKPPIKPQSKTEQSAASEAITMPDSKQEPSLVSESTQPKKNWKKRIAIAAIVAAVLALLTVFSIWFWYKTQLSPVQPGSNEKVKVSVPTGIGPSDIATLLKQKDVIRSESAFNWYVRIQGVSGKLQSGSYRLGKGEDVPAIVTHLTSGTNDTFSITFLPGNTLAKHRKTLLNAGYSKDTVDAALKANYEGLSLFNTKPKSADLEGYIYGETYNFLADATPRQILLRTFEEFQSVVDKNNLAAAYKKRGLTLYEGITLASIIQREVVTEADMAQVSQVFHLRLKQGMMLGSDVTYQYAADKMGVERDVNLDSPYNTRRFTGLPPGPIASPSEAALIAVGAPASGDYLYFLSGDDDKTYFARTNEEHEQNIRDHCREKCQII